MILRKLKERMVPVKASPLPDRVRDSYVHRRGGNSITMEDEGDSMDKYDTFFDYEDDLANLKPSSEQYAEMVSNDPYVILEDRDDAIEDAPLPIVMSDADIDDNDKENTKYTDVVGFQFIQCSFIKRDGERCKRQAPKGQDICSVHKKYINKHGHNNE